MQHEVVVRSGMHPCMALHVSHARYKCLAQTQHSRLNCMYATQGAASAGCFLPHMKEVLKHNVSDLGMCDPLHHRLHGRCPLN